MGEKSVLAEFLENYEFGGLAVDRAIQKRISSDAFLVDLEAVLLEGVC